MVQPVSSREAQTTAFHNIAHDVKIKQFGGDTNDNTQSSIAPASENKESWGECMTRWLCFVPNLILAGLKLIVCCLTLGFFCNEKVVDNKEVAELFKKFLDAENKDKDAAWKKIEAADPKIEGNLVNFSVDKVRKTTLTAAQLKDKAAVEKWNKDHLADAKTVAEKLVKDKDANFLTDYKKMLDAKVAASESNQTSS